MSRACLSSSGSVTPTCDASPMAGPPKLNSSRSCCTVIWTRPATSRRQRDARLLGRTRTSGPRHQSGSARLAWVGVLRRDPPGGSQRLAPRICAGPCRLSGSLGYSRDSGGTGGACPVWALPDCGSLPGRVASHSHSRRHAGGAAGLGGAWQGRLTARPQLHIARHGLAWQVEAWQCEARPGMARPGTARRGRARRAGEDRPAARAGVIRGGPPLVSGRLMLAA